MMLRTVILLVAMLLFTGALIGVAVDPAVWPTLLVTAVLTAGVAFERRRYGLVRARPAAAEWRRTTERFVDSASGRPVTVWYNDATGERRYVGDDDGATP